METKSVHLADITVIVIYFLLVLATGIWSSMRSKKDSVKGYFLASRSMHWIPVGASLFASNIGSGHFIGMAGGGASSGIALSSFNMNSVFAIIGLGWVFVPVYLASGVYTMPEYLKMRFGGTRIRMYLAVLNHLLYIFIKISADLYAGALFIQQALGWDLYLSILSLLIVAGFFTLGGGLTTVIWTDLFQMVIMVIGSLVLTGIGFQRVGGYYSLLEKYLVAEPNVTVFNANNVSCSALRPDALHIFRSAVPGESDLPWTGVVFGLTISAIWYWCTDQVIVQRALAAKNLTHAKAGCILVGYLKLLPMFMLVFPGMIARVLFPDEVACVDPDICEQTCGSRDGCSNIAYPLLVLRIMPKGLSGMMVAVLMAALMSSLTSIFNSSSTIFTVDLWSHFRKNATEIEQLIVGRTFVVLMVAISVIWIPVIQAFYGSSLFDYMQSMTSFLSPPICAVFILAVLCERVNEQGAFWGMMIGLVIGMLRFTLQFLYPVPKCGSDDILPRPLLIKYFVDNVHYLHFGCILFVIVCVATILISLVTEPIPESRLHRLTFWSRYSDKPRDNIDYQEEDELIKTALQIEEAPPLSNEKPNISMGRKLINFLCSVQTQDRKKACVNRVLSPEMDAKIHSTVLIENPLWCRFANMNAVIVIAVVTFIFGFYA